MLLFFFSNFAIYGAHACPGSGAEGYIRARGGTSRLFPGWMRAALLFSPGYREWSTLSRSEGDGWSPEVGLMVNYLSDLDGRFARCRAHAMSGFNCR